MRELNIINQELDKIIDDQNRNKIILRKINNAYNEKQLLTTRLREMELQLVKEEKDVTKLKSLSLSNLYHTLKSDKDEALRKEEKEALEAKIQLDQVTFQLSEINKLIEQLEQDKIEPSSLTIIYNRLIEEKEAIIKETSPENLGKLTAIQNGINIKTLEIKELDEAIGAGNMAYHQTQEIISELNKAADWGVFDMLGGGLLATMAKQDHMENAKDELEQFQYYLKSYNKELSDVTDTIQFDLDLDGFLGFADYFFDSFFVDWAIQDKIDSARGKVESLSSKIQSMQSRLNKERSAVKSQITQLKADSQQIIIQA